MLLAGGGTEEPQVFQQKCLGKSKGLQDGGGPPGPDNVSRALGTEQLWQTANAKVLRIRGDFQTQYPERTQNPDLLCLTVTAVGALQLQSAFTFITSFGPGR